MKRERKRERKIERGGGKGEGGDWFEILSIVLLLFDSELEKVGSRENSGYQQFFLLLQWFQKPAF